MNRRTKAQWRELISQQQSSSLSAAEFCRRESVNPKYFSVRKKQLSDALPNFVEAVVSSEPKVDSSSNLIKLRIIDLDVPLDKLACVLDQLRR